MTKTEFITYYLEKNLVIKPCNCCVKIKFFPDDYYVCKSPTTKTGWFVRKTCNKCYNKARNAKKPLEVVRTATKIEPVQNHIAVKRAREIFENIYGKVRR